MAKLKNKKSRPIRKNHNFKHERKAKRNSVKKHKMCDQWTENSLFHDDSKTLQKLEANKSMTIKAKGIMMSFVSCLYKWVPAEVERFRRARNRPNIGSSEMRSALQHIMLGECKCRAYSPKTGEPRQVKIS
ncbi:histone H2B type 1-M-like [Anolis sagrei]|uniref:histone H2B type 1-M-like n=1 Tax=Anolis sagrei TaxID=38937 RepID=UPI0035219E35